MESSILEPSRELDVASYAVIGAAMEVHRVLGPGFLETVYDEALAIELGLRKIPFERQRPISVSYKGHRIGEGRLDYLVSQSLVVELKAVDTLLPVHHAQLLSYLKAGRYRLGLLINFHVRLLKDGIKRMVFSSGIAI